MPTDETKAVVEYQGSQITVTFKDVKDLICPNANDQEVTVFLRYCQSLNLNPFAKEIYLIKYGEKDKAAIVIAIDSYMKAAELNPHYDGHEAGIILRYPSGPLEFREGAFILEDEMDKLVGGWARVFRKGRRKPFYIAVNKTEAVRYKADGQPTQFWVPAKQPTMLRKTALKRALFEAFPTLFGGTLSNAEYEGGNIVEGEFEEVSGEALPPAFEKDGKPDWTLFWTKQKSKGLTEQEVHSILGVSSVMLEWFGKGHSLEEADEIVNDALAEAGGRKQEKLL